MKRVSVGILTVCLALLVGCSKNPNVQQVELDTSKPIVKVNDATITETKFNKTFENGFKKSFMASKNVDLKAPQNKLIYLIYKDKAVNELIIRELISQESKKRNIQVSESDINKAVDEIAQKLGGKAKLEATLTLNNVDKKDFYENVKLDLITKKLIDNVAAGTKVPESEIKKFYDQNKATKFTFPDQVRAQHILVSASETDIRAKVESENSGLTETQITKKVQDELNKAKAKAEKVLSEAKASPLKFEELAKKYSDDTTTAEKGGDLGFFSKNDMVPAFSKVAFSTTPGQISDVVKTEFGYHIIKVADRKKAGITPYEEVKNEISQYLQDQERLKVLQKIIIGARNTANIQYLDPQYDPKTIQEEVKKLAKEQKDQAPGLAKTAPVKK